MGRVPCETSQRTAWLCLIVEHSQPDQEQRDRTEDNLDRISKRMSTKEKEITRRKEKIHNGIRQAVNSHLDRPQSRSFARIVLATVEDIGDSIRKLKISILSSTKNDRTHERTREPRISNKARTRAT